MYHICKFRGGKGKLCFVIYNTKREIRDLHPNTQLYTEHTAYLNRKPPPSSTLVLNSVIPPSRTVKNRCIRNRRNFQNFLKIFGDAHWRCNIFFTLNE